MSQDLADQRAEILEALFKNLAKEQPDFNFDDDLQSNLGPVVKNIHYLVTDNSVIARGRVNGENWQLVWVSMERESDAATCRLALLNDKSDEIVSRVLGIAERDVFEVEANHLLQDVIAVNNFIQAGDAFFINVRGYTDSYDGDDWSHPFITYEFEIKCVYDLKFS